MMIQRKISVSDALKMIESEQSLKGYSIDFANIKVEALDSLKLARNGIEVPEAAIYYDDDNIVDDEAFAGEWKMIDYDPTEGIPDTMELKINLNHEVNAWLKEKNVKLDVLVENLLNGFYRSQRIIENKE